MCGGCPCRQRRRPGPEAKAKVRRNRPLPEVFPTPGEVALKNFRKKFAMSWKKCGELKKQAAEVQHVGGIGDWKRFVSHKLFQFYHHNLSEILKELKRTRNAERLIV